jgi:transposase InsO family protein
VSKLCRALEVTRAGYYAWRNRWPSEHRMKDAELLERMRKHFHDSRGTYGSPRLHALLKREGFRISSKRVVRLMQGDDLKARAARLYRRMPGMTNFFAKIPNRLPDVILRPNRVWVGDITFLKLRRRWRFLATVMDKHSRRIVGWSFGHDRTANLTVAAFRRAVANRRPSPGLVYHSDRGVEYASYAFGDRLQKLGVTQSMNRPKHMNDNAHMESFFHSMKSEALTGCRFETEEQLKRAIRSYIRHYNSKRPHSSLGYLSPIDFERQPA